MFSERRCAPRSTKIIHYSLFTILSIKKQGFRPCFFAFFDGALLRYRPFYSIVKHE